jgi:hypothetical protein
MIPGLNSNVSHGGVEYHVQTEDLGRANAYVLTLVFRAGAIIAREKVNYRDALGEGASEARVKSFMDQQHSRIIQRIMAGQLLEPAASRSAEEAPSQAAATSLKLALPPADKTLDQLIVEYLRSRNAARRR